MGDFTKNAIVGHNISSFRFTKIGFDDIIIITPKFRIVNKERYMYKNIKNYPDLWRYLQNTDKKILLYGMGNGADKILSVAQRYGIEISDFFASDGFVRGHTFHGKRVLSYSEAKEKYGGENMIVLLSFATRLDDVLENIYRIADECELYSPDVPVYGDEIFNIEFFEEHKEEIEAARKLFCDNESKRIYDLIIKYKLTGMISYLRECESNIDECYNDILCADSFEITADLGAYNGDSARELMEYAKNLKKIIALEPDSRNYRKLLSWTEGVQAISIEAHNLGAWDREDTLYFDASGNRNASLTENISIFSDAINQRKKKIAEVKVNSLDNILCGRRVDYIKYDVEGSEYEAICGSADTIKTHKPSLLVSLYHQSRDVFFLPLYIKSICPEYSLCLRRFKYIPAWDINLYAKIN